MIERKKYLELLATRIENNPVVALLGPRQIRAALSSRVTSLYWFNLSLRSLVTFPDLIEPMTRVGREIRMRESRGGLCARAETRRAGPHRGPTPGTSCRRERHRL